MEWYNTGQAFNNPDPSASFFQEKGEKEALENFKHVIKICPNRTHIVQNKLQNTWTAKLKLLTI